MSTTTMRVVDLRENDLGAAVDLHRTVMAGEFLAGSGRRFLHAYYQAWHRSPAGMALAATDSDGNIVGTLLGSVDPAAHYRAIVRQSGARLTVRLAGQAIRHPRWGAAVARRRGPRYLRGLVRIFSRPRRGPAGMPRRPFTAEPLPSPLPIAEITHLMVAPDCRGRRLGRDLVEEAARRAEAAGSAMVVVVTPPGWPAEQFYARLGWVRRGELTSASGERFVAYELALSAAGDRLAAA